MKVAIITGITGQDGSYLAELLLSKGYEVYGVIRKTSSSNVDRILHIKDKIHLRYADLGDSSSVKEILREVEPDEVYNLGAQSHVGISFDMPEYTFDITALGAVRILEGIRRLGLKTRFYQASSSEMFGISPPPQNENSPMIPQSPYAIAKLCAYHFTRNYRESFGIYASNGIFFNHESPRRGENFVTRKITLGIAQVLSGKQEKVELGNLYAKRDWGFAPEYVEVMWRILQQDEPDDYVVGTGETHSVKEFIEEALQYLKIDIEWRGEGVDEVGLVRSFDKKWNLKTGKILVSINPKLIRPAEVGLLKADYSKAKRKLNWEPKVRFKELVKIMVDYDLRLCGLEPPGEGIKIASQYTFTQIY